MQSDSSSGEERFQVRKLEISDQSKGFVELLQQLTICDSVSDQDFEDRFQELAALGDDHVIGVIEDDRNGKIIASGSVFIEKKFIRNCWKVGHIEDVVVDFNARGMQLGKKLIEFLVDHARSVGCYKVILDCSDENREFYKKCGFERKEIQMKPLSPSMNTGRGLSSFSPTVTTTVTLDNSAAASSSSSQPRQPETLVIRLNPRKKKVTWKEGTVDNEFMQKKSSKKCCIFHKEKPFDEDDSDGDDDGHCDHRHGDGGPCCSNNNGAESSATPSH